MIITEPNLLKELTREDFQEVDGHLCVVKHYARIEEVTTVKEITFLLQ